MDSDAYVYTDVQRGAKLNENNENIRAVVPVNLNGTAISPTAVNLNWTPSEGATSYRIYRSETENGTDTPIAETTDTTYTDTGLIPGRTYYYRISSYEAENGESESAGPIAVTLAELPAPQNIQARITEANQVEVSWDAVDSANEYALYRGTNPAGPFTQIAVVDTTGGTDANVNPGTTYYYQVQARYEGVGGAISAPIEVAIPVAVPIPAAPTGVTVTAVNCAAGLTWNPVAGATGYRIFRSANPAGPFTQIGDSVLTNYTDDSLNRGTTYYYQVAAYNRAGTGPTAATVSVTTASRCPDPCCDCYQRIVCRNGRLYCCSVPRRRRCGCDCCR